LSGEHDAASMRVVVGVGGDHEQDVQREPDPVAADLDVALLQDVEQRHLDALGEVGELVDRDDPPMRARDHAVVDRQLVGQVPTLGHADRVDVADQVRDARIRGRELLAVALVGREPGDRCGVAFGSDQLAATRADGPVRVIVDLAAGDHGDGIVKEVDDRADQAGLGLTALAQEDQVVPREDPAFERREDGVLEAEDAGEQFLPQLETAQEVRSELLLDGPVGGAGGAQFTDGAWLRHVVQGTADPRQRGRSALVTSRPWAPPSGSWLR
jgi:hypothetical protein